ncbi:response regulator [Aquincola sp. S2]|uniref:Response regulator n=1 Tax=Pseudaquabacterium terrae TaxID=2732868 RepID=A0ABX2EKB2_9BURK|nr:response regulator [Aquabacterium terrae]NRF69063.1 response regulator [Aquabacterium terrae]
MNPTRTPYRFMVVDDSRAIRAIVARLIEQCGYPEVEVKRAADGEEALSLLPSFTPQLMITDWHMPRVSGLELLQTLRQLGQTNVKIGFVTTESRPAMLEQARTNGAAFIVNKPFRDNELIDHIRAAVPYKAPAAPAAANVTPRAAPAAAPAAALPERPLRIDHAQGLIEHTLGGQDFSLKLHAAMEPGALGPNNLLGLYSAPGKPAAAVGVLDLSAVCLVGGGALRLPVADITAAQLAGEPHDAMVAQATTFLRAAGMMLQVDNAPEGCTLARSMAVPAAFPKLVELLERGGERCDYQLAIPGLGEGRMTFIAL